MNSNHQNNISRIRQNVLDDKSFLEKNAQNYIDNIKKLNPKINSFIYFSEETIYEQIKALLRRDFNIEYLPLLGAPIVIKDNIDCMNMPLTNASKIMANYKSPLDATCVKKLKEAGAIILGKANMDEFAMGSANLNSAFGAVRNPWDLMRVPGGSSGGSAASVSSDMALVALGSDTGGSIRQPASFCGVFGLKPSYGTVSRKGLTAFASSLDQIGPIAQNLDDLWAVYCVICGEDTKDSTNLFNPKVLESTDLDIKKIKIGLLSETTDYGVEEDISNCILAVSEKLKEHKIEVTTVSLTSLKKAVAVYYILATAEASANLARFDGVRYGKRNKDARNLLDLYETSRSEGFGEEVKKRIILGTYVLSSGYREAYYQKALSVKSQIIDELNTAFESFDFIMMPTTPNTAFKLNREESASELEDYLNDIFTIPANLSGCPAISLPCGINKHGLPIGVQFMAKNFSDAKLWSFAKWIQINTSIILQENPRFLNADKV